jgi:hypothetical protein
MSAKGVNLDALIPREDFAVEGGVATGTADATISIHHLANNNFFTGSLRKPDFQRETVSWTPSKVADLVEAFLDGKLIPAIILWRSGQFNFIIDGAHRVSAMLAWVYDDYGDKRRSLNFFGNHITEEQYKLADQTRKLVNSQVGPFSEYNDAMADMFNAPEHLKSRLAGLARNSFVAQWVPETDAEGAQNSFFKINQQATPLDPIERRILKARRSATAIATRAITRAGTGHRYWQTFERAKSERIERLGKEIHDALYLPPMGGLPIKTSDVPVAGRGYNALPFVFDLVNLANNVRVADSTTAREVNDELPQDQDGDATLQFLEAVKGRVRRITSNDPASLGLHPLVYFYTRSGKFQTTAFLAVSNFVANLIEQQRLDEFTRVRARLESFLVERKEAYSLVVTKLGSGVRSRPALESFFSFVFERIVAGKTDAEILHDLGADAAFYFLATPQPRRPSGNSDGSFSTSVKSAAFIQELSESGVKCGICKALVHRNSIQTDHITPKSEGGGAHGANAQVSHPYCNSTYKQRRS